MKRKNKCPKFEGRNAAHLYFHVPKFELRLAKILMGKVFLSMNLKVSFLSFLLLQVHTRPLKPALPWLSTMETLCFMGAGATLFHTLYIRLAQFVWFLNPSSPQGFHNAIVYHTIKCVYPILTFLDGHSRFCFTSLLNYFLLHSKNYLEQ